MPDAFPLEPRVGVRLEKRRGRGASLGTIVFDVFTDLERRATFFALVAEPPPGGSESFARRRTRFCISPLSRTLGRALLFPR